MTVSAREATLAAFFEQLDTVDDAVALTRLRLLASRLAAGTQLPALVQLDGGETVQDLETGVLAIETRVAVLLVHKAATAAELATGLNAMRAAVLQALWADPRLGGLAIRVRYDGCDDPEVDEDADVLGQLQLFFTIERGEYELDPLLAA